MFLCPEAPPEAVPSLHLRVTAELAADPVRPRRLQAALHGAAE